MARTAFLQIGRIEGGIELGGAVIARLVAKLRRHLPCRHAVLAHPARDGVADRIGIDLVVQFRRFPHAAPGLVDLLDRTPLKRDEPAGGALARTVASVSGILTTGRNFLVWARPRGLRSISRSSKSSCAPVRSSAASGRQAVPIRIISITRRWSGASAQQARKLCDFQRPAQRLAVIDLDAVNAGVIFPSLGEVIFPSRRGAIRRWQVGPVVALAGGHVGAEAR